MSKIHLLEIFGNHAHIEKELFWYFAKFLRNDGGFHMIKQLDKDT